MRTFKSLMISLCMGTTLCMCLPQTTTAQTVSSGDSWKWDKGTIVIDTPERPSGQKSVLGLTIPKMEVVRVGFVGLGMRGPGAVERFTYIPGTQIVALCDYEASRAEKCQDILKKASMPKAAIYSGEKGYEELCKRTDIDLVYIAADWLHHFPIAKCALENGKHVAIEVPSAMNLQPWRFVVTDGKIHMFVKKPGKIGYQMQQDFNLFDAGIALAHMLVTAEEQWFDLEYQKLDSILEKDFPNNMYVGSLLILNESEKI